jgi:hypothetical protein
MYLDSEIFEVALILRDSSGGRLEAGLVDFDV